MTNEPSLDPSSSDFEKQVEARLYQYAEEYSREKYPAEHRNHLGASSIGEECWRKLWYNFRWVKLQQAEGRMRRLWNRGHREEAVLEEFLLWAGFSGRSVDDTGKQFKFSKVDGHYGGSTDGRWEIRWASNLRIVVDYKTFAYDYFTKLEKEKLKVSNPKYYAQLCAYGEEFKATHGLLFGVNKDNDAWYFELIKLDWNYAKELEIKARDIIYSTIPPPKINENPSYWKCKFCDARSICHFNEPVEKNCRSCVNADPVANGKWSCKLHGEIPKEFIPKGCDSYRGIV